ncbi:hypothetical protein [Hyalangium versicolor]|uniref:hypothetical protein n=1 Tax=Hyalangium versicolor TaxID=2861190 RepID=UPI001CCE8FD5|nr:hypothetical protein [Hyalangium versicolor]
MHSLRSSCSRCHDTGRLPSGPDDRDGGDTLCDCAAGDFLLAVLNADPLGPAYADEDLDSGPTAGDAGVFPPDAEDLSELRPAGVYEAGESRLFHQKDEGGVLSGTRCSVCGCTDALPCPGGCIWANASATLCSRCSLSGGAHG